MKQNEAQLWNRFQKFYTDFPAVGLAIDLSRTDLDEEAWKPRLPSSLAFSVLVSKDRSLGSWARGTCGSWMGWSILGRGRAGKVFASVEPISMMGDFASNCLS